MKTKSGGGVFLKIAIGLALAAVVVFVGATLALKKYLPPEKVRSLIIENAQKSLGREVRLEGVSLNILSGLTVSRLEISEAPDFTAGKFASIESFQLRIQLLPLLGRRVVVDQIELKGLSVTVIKGKKGGFNFDDLKDGGKTDKPDQPSSGPPKLPFELNVSRTIVSDARLTYKDEAQGTQWDLSGIEVEIKDFSLENPFSVSAQLSASGSAGKKPVEAKVFFKGGLSLAGLDTARMSIGIDELKVEAEGFTLEAVGSIEGLGPATAKLKAKVFKGDKKIFDSDLRVSLLDPKDPGGIKADISVHLAPLDTSDLNVDGIPQGITLPGADLTAKFSLSGETLTLSSLEIKTPAAGISVSGKVLKTLSKPDPRLNITAKLDLPKLTDKDLSFVKGKGLPQGLALPASSFRADLALQGLGSVELRSLKVRLGKTDLDISGRVSKLMSGNPALALDIKSGKLDLAELAAIVPQGRELKVSGSASVNLSVGGTRKNPSVKGRVKLKGVGAVVSNLALSGFGGNVAFSPDRISLVGLRGKVGDGDLKVSLTVRNYLKAPDIDLTADLSRLDLDKLFAGKKPGAVEKELESKAEKKPKTDPPGTVAIKARGKVTIGEIVHTHAKARGLKLVWNLSGITPSMRKLSGSASLDVDSGEFESLDAISRKSGLLKAVLFPLMILQKLGKLGGLGLFPDLSHVKFSEITGRYTFKNGLMTLQKSRLVSTVAKIDTTGTIDIPEEKLALSVKAEIARVPLIQLDVKGTFAAPKARLNIAKTLAAPVKKLIEGGGLKDLLKGKPARDILKGLFGR